MARKPVSDQRRSPSQARSRATWEAIVEAAAQILERGGAAAFSTGAVAERAGVSIGTLYQYFPDKQAILAAAAKRELGEGSAAPPARRRALIEALIAMVEGLGRFGAGVTASGVAAPIRKAQRETGWEHRCAEALDLMTILLIGPQPALRPLRIDCERRPPR
jgi:AcrR family transcriptional regulator